MAANALIQTRIDAVVKEQATAVLDNMGMTVSDAVRILLTRVAKEGALPVGLTTDPVAHDAWFRDQGPGGARLCSPGHPARSG